MLLKEQLDELYDIAIHGVGTESSGGYRYMCQKVIDLIVHIEELQDLVEGEHEIGLSYRAVAESTFRALGEWVAEFGDGEKLRAYNEIHTAFLETPEQSSEYTEYLEALK
jgi:hypothetical protein